MSRSPLKAGGPSFYDLHGALTHLEKSYPVLCTVEMAPRFSKQGGFRVRVVVDLVPRSAAENMVKATQRPGAIVWEAEWSPESLLDLPSLLFRGCFEVEAEIIALMEQLGLPC